MIFSTPAVTHPATAPVRRVDTDDIAVGVFCLHYVQKQLLNREASVLI